MQPWKEFGPNIRPCRFAVSPLNLTADGAKIICQGKKLCSPKYSPPFGVEGQERPRGLYLEQVKGKSGADKAWLE